MKDAIEVSIIFHEGQRMFAVPKQSEPVQGLPFGVGGGLVAIKTLLSRDPCVHANTAIEMIDAILKEHTAAQPAPVPLTDEQRKNLWVSATIESPSHENCYYCGLADAEAYHGITEKGQP